MKRMFLVIIAMMGVLFLGLTSAMAAKPLGLTINADSQRYVYVSGQQNVLLGSFTILKDIPSKRMIVMVFVDTDYIQNHKMFVDGEKRGVYIHRGSIIYTIIDTSTNKKTAHRVQVIGDIKPWAKDCSDRLTNLSVCSMFGGKIFQTSADGQEIQIFEHGELSAFRMTFYSSYYTSRGMRTPVGIFGMLTRFEPVEITGMVFQLNHTQYSMFTRVHLTGPDGSKIGEAIPCPDGKIMFFGLAVPCNDSLLEELTIWADISPYAQKDEIFSVDCIEITGIGQISGFEITVEPDIKGPVFTIY